MNRTSAGERGGSVALVDSGSVRVGWPGAPGCTTTGVAGSACCAQTGSENKPARIPPAISTLRHVESFITDGSLRLLGMKSFDSTLVSQKLRWAHLITKRHQGHWGRLGICAILCQHYQPGLEQNPLLTDPNFLVSGFSLHPRFQDLIRKVGVPQ